MRGTFALIAFHGINRAFGNTTTMIGWDDEGNGLEWNAKNVGKSLNGRHVGKHVMRISANIPLAAAPLYPHGAASLYRARYQGCRPDGGYSCARM